MVTQHIHYKYTMEAPDILFSRHSHDVHEPVQAHTLKIDLRFNQAPTPAYTGPLKMDTKKLTDLSKLAEFVHGEAYAFYTALIQEQRELRLVSSADGDDDTGDLNIIQQAAVQEQQEIDEVETGLNWRVNTLDTV